MIILGLQVEDTDGARVLKSFKKACPSMEVIMLRGYGSERAARDGLARGAFVYLTKPCYSDHLVHKIGPACRKEGGGASG